MRKKKWRKRDTNPMGQKWKDHKKQITNFFRQFLAQRRFFWTPLLAFSWEEIVFLVPTPKKANN